MREHKYRARDKKTKQMVGVVAIVYSDFQIEAECDDDLGEPEVDEGVWIKVYLEVAHRDFKDVELMQYTGLKDQTDEGIYEGDIIQNMPFPNFVVKYESGNWNYAHMHRASYGDTSEWLTIPEKEWLIIGNIKENPELMEAEQ